MDEADVKLDHRLLASCVGRRLVGGEELSPKRLG